MIIDEYDYIPSLIIRNKHLQTIYPTFLKRAQVNYEREKINTPDGDFIEVDWIRNGNASVVVLFHGLEGHSYAHYIRGLAKVLSGNNLDVVAVNFRGCSGKPNNHLFSYHSGQTDDYKLIFDHLNRLNAYKKVFAVGFSLGGNALLKYLGERGGQSLVDKAVGVSVPCDLAASAVKISSGFNKIYLKRFLTSLKEKVRMKESIFPDKVDYKRIYEAKDFFEFDSLFTAPTSGFKDAHDYYEKNSSVPFIKDIKTDTIILNSKNDPFLPKESYPHAECELNPNVQLFTPEHGGHVGFPKKVNGMNYYERVIIEHFN